MCVDNSLLLQPNASLPYSSNTTETTLSSSLDWKTIRQSQPRSIGELVSNASLGIAQGNLDYRAGFNVGSPWSTNSTSVNSSPVCSANGSDSLQNVADAQQWNFTHKTWDNSLEIPIPMRSKIVLRAGVRWSMAINLNWVIARSGGYELDSRS